MGESIHSYDSRTPNTQRDKGIFIAQLKHFSKEMLKGPASTWKMLEPFVHYEGVANPYRMRMANTIVKRNRASIAEDAEELCHLDWQERTILSLWKQFSGSTKKLSIGMDGVA